MKIPDRNIDRITAFEGADMRAFEPISAEIGLDDQIVDEVDKLREELQAERDSRLRLGAEYQNYRRRTEQEKALYSESGKREILTQLLAIADDLDRAAEQPADARVSVIEGVAAIRRRFAQILEANGVISFNSEGEKFDPERHEAFDVASSGEVESGMVYMEMRRGYFWNGKLLRPSLVMVKE